MNPINLPYIESILSSHTPEAESAVIAFSKHFASYPLNEETAPVYGKILFYNNPKAIDALLKTRNPYSLFSKVPPSQSLLLFAFSTLRDFRYNELYEPVVLACLGIIQTGYKIYPPTVSDLYHTAKYLKITNSEIEIHLIDFLEDLCSLSKHKNITALARTIINAHYDSSKKIETIIPSSVLS